MILYVIIAVILGGLILGWQRRKRFLAALHLSPDALWKILIPIFIVVILLIVVGEPAIEKTVSVKEYSGADIVYVVDISLSMRAKDNTGSSRLDRAKEFIANCNAKSTDEKVALVIFAGEAFSWLPFLTTDKMLLDFFALRLSTNLMSARGTDFADAVLKAARILEDSSNKVIVLLSDGEIQGERVTDIVKAINVINKLGIDLYVVPIGSINGSCIPMEDNTVLRDANEQIVKTRLRLDILQSLARATGGKIVEEPFKVRESSREFIGEKQVVTEKALFQILLVLTLLLLVANILFRK